MRRQPLQPEATETTTVAQADKESVEAETGWLSRLCTVRKALTRFFVFPGL
jgi:hypothetical protein